MVAPTRVTAASPARQMSSYFFSASAAPVPRAANVKSHEQPSGYAWEKCAMMNASGDTASRTAR